MIKNVKLRIFCIVVFFIKLSLNSLLADVSYTTHYVDSLLNKINEYTSVDNNLALELANKAIDIAKKIEYHKGAGSAYYKRAVLYYYTAEYKKAEEDLQQSLNYRLLVNDEKGIADVYLMQGIILDAYYQHDKAIEIFYKAIDKYEKIKDIDGLSSAYGNIAISYNIINDYNNALKYQRKSLELAYKINDYESVAISYFDIATSYDKMNALEKALLYLDSAEYYYNKTNKNQGLATILNSKGLVLKKLKRYDEAFNCYNKAIAINIQLNHKTGSSQTYLNLGELYLIKKDFENAEKYLLLAKELSEQIDNYEVLPTVYKLLSTLYKNQNKFSEALKYYEEYVELNDSSSINETKKRMLMLQAYYNDKQKENEITILNQKNKIKDLQIRRQNFIIILSIILLALFALTIYLWYSRYKEKSRLNAILAEQNNQIQLQKAEIEKQNIQLADLNAYKSRFYANISHELRTPLTLIVSPLEQLITSCNEINQKETLLLMHRNTLRLQNLINQMLELAKIERNEIMLQLDKIDIKNFIKGIVNNFSYEASNKNISLILSDKIESFDIYSDIEKLETIIINLISNSLKNTSHGGFIGINIKKSENNFEISVIDNGKGIQSEDLPHIFKRFYKVDETSPGQGIGLSIVKEFVNILRGEINVSSTPYEQTCFTVKFPINPYPEIITIFSAENKNLLSADENILVEDAIPVNEKDKPLVLVVEDNDDMLAYLNKQLQSYFRIINAHNGSEALEIAIDKYPDCIVADIMMPVLDGLEMVKALKNNILISHIPVILLTAKTSEKSIIQGLETDADDYITKPFKINILIARIKNLIRNRMKLREIFLNGKKDFHVKEISVTSIDEKFLARAIEVVEENMISSEFDVTTMCRELAISRSNLHRKLVAITGMTTTEFIKTIRLRHAAKLIEQNAGSISEIAYKVGFDNLSYFTRCFKDYFKVTPLQYKNNK